MSLTADLDTSLARRLLATASPLSEAEARDWLLPVTAALAAMHAEGRTHLGVSAETVLRSGEGVRLAAVDHAHDVRAWLMRHDLFVPEAERGGLGPPSDVYLWGLLAHEVLTGQPVARGGFHPAFADPDLAASALSHLPPPWGAVLAGCLVWSPLQRLTASAVARSLSPGLSRVEEPATVTLGVLPAGHLGAVSQLAVSPSGDEVASLGEDGTVRRWRLTTGHPSLVGVLRSQQATRLAYDPQGVLTVAREDGAAPLAVPPEESGPAARQVHAVSPDGSLVAAQGGDAGVRVRRTRDGICVMNLEGLSSEVRALAFSPLGTHLAVAAAKGDTRLYRLSDGMCIDTLRAGHEGVTVLAFTPDGRRVLAGCGEGAVRSWPVRAAPAAVLPFGQHGGVRTATFTADHTRLVVASEAFVQLWRLTDGVCQATLDRSPTASCCLAVSPDGRTLAMQGVGGLIELWSLETFERLAVHDTFSDIPRGLAFTPDGTRLVATSASGDLVVRRLADWALLAHHREPGLSGHLVMAPDGRCAYLGTTRGVILRLQLGTWVLDDAVHAAYGCKAPLAASPDGRWLALLDDADRVRLWDVVGRCSVPGTEHPAVLGGPAAFSPDSKQLAFETGTGVAIVATDGGLPERQALEGSLTALTFSDDGATLLCSTTDRVVHAWRIEDRRVQRLHDFARAGQGQARRPGNGLRVRNGGSPVDLVEGPVLQLSPPPAPDTPGVLVAVDGSRVGWQALDGLHVRSLSEAGPAPPAVRLPPGARVVALGAGGRSCLCRGGDDMWLLRLDTAERVTLPAASPAAFTPDGSGIVVATAQGVEVHDVETGAFLGGLACHDDILAASASRDGGIWVWAREDGWLGAYRTTGAAGPSAVRVVDGAIDGVALAPDGRSYLAVVGAHAYHLRLDGHVLAFIEGPAGTRIAAAWRRDALVLAARAQGSEVASTWLLQPGTPTPADGDAACIALGLREEGRTMVALLADGRVVLQDRATGRTITEWSLSSGPMEPPFAIDPTGRWVLGSGVDDNALVVRAAHDGFKMPRLRSHALVRGGGTTRQVAFDSGGERLAAALDTHLNDLVVLCWDVATGAVSGTWQHPAGPSTALALGPGGTEVAVGNRLDEATPVVLLGNLEAGTGVGALHAHRAPVTALAYSAEGRHLASGDEAGRVVCWARHGWRRVWSREVPLALTHLVFTPDGAQLLARATDGSLRGWRVADGEPVVGAPSPWGGAEPAAHGALAVSNDAAVTAIVPLGVGVQALRAPATR